MGRRAAHRYSHDVALPLFGFGTFVRKIPDGKIPGLTRHLPPHNAEEETTPQMYHDPSETILRQKAREAMQNSKLPSRRPDRFLGGSGSGDACAVCNLLVTWRMAELELEFQYMDGVTLRIEAFKLHHRCFASWELERHTIESTATGS